MEARRGGLTVFDEDTPIFREVAEAQAAGRYPVRSASPTAGRHHWREDDREMTDPHGDVNLDRSDVR